MTPVRILITDDEQLIRSGLKLMLDSFDRIEVVGTAVDGAEAHQRCSELRPDVVLMDIRMPGTDGIEGTKRILSDYPQTKVLILTTFQDTEYITEAMNYGASGYLLKDSTPESIAEAIQVAMASKIVLDPSISAQLLNAARHSAQAVVFAENVRRVREQYGLSEREIEIIHLVALGLNNRDIAGSLHLSEGTVKNNVSALLAALELPNRTRLVIFAYEEGLVQPGS